MATRKRTRAQANREHNALIRALMVEVSRRWKGAVYIDQVTQYRGEVIQPRSVPAPMLGEYAEVTDFERKAWVSAGMTDGTFDVFVCARGRAIWLDAKTGGAKLTKEQRQFQSWIRRAGGVAEPFGSVEDGIRVIEEVMR